MSLIYMAQAFKVKLGAKSHLRKLVLLKLCDNANDDGVCWPSMSHISDQCEISSRSAIRCINDLEKLGLLTVLRTVKNNKKQTNKYQIDLNRMMEMSVNFAASSDTQSPSSSDTESLQNSISSDTQSPSSDTESLSSSDTGSHRTCHSTESVNKSNKKNIQKKTDPKIKKIRELDWSLMPDLTDEQKLEIIEIRKANGGPPFTDRSLRILLNGFIESAQHGIGFEECMNIWSSRGWRTLEADWALNHKFGSNGINNNFAGGGHASRSPAANVVNLDSIDY